jgi:ubiquitin C-terminal hydrolase
MFYGLQMMKMKCQHCQKVTNSFDVFNSLSLPLYDTDSVKLQVVVQRLSWKVKSTFRQDEDNDAWEHQIAPAEAKI